MQPMTSEDLCPATGRECHNAICETGGCRKARSKPATKPIARRSPVAAMPSSDAAAKRLEQEIAAATALKAEVAAIFTDTLEALQHSDAALTHLQQALGVKSSPRLEQLRSAAARMRDFLRDHPLPKPGAPEPDGSAESAAPKPK